MKNNAKNFRIDIRLSEAEKAEIAYQAALNDMSISEYVLKCVQRKRIVVCDNFPDLLYQLSALGNNLNQIAAVANTNKYISEKQIEATKNILTECYEKMSEFVSYICEPNEKTTNKQLSDEVVEEINNALAVINSRINQYSAKNEKKEM
ncbi:plasmid mobilization protein [Ruminococcus sp.]|uniref:plasmid mobilization protein n=1 Tax=Ruminococcus sp. TaxID=41978 RepID=UPI00386E1D86